MDHDNIACTAPDGSIYYYLWSIVGRTKLLFYKNIIFEIFRLIWNWDEGVKLLQKQDIQPDRNKLQANQVMKLIEQKL